MRTAKSSAFRLGCVAVIGAGMLAGCTSYYRVTDPASGKVFYTTDIDQSGRAGYVEFKDAKSQSKVTLQSSEVTKISKDDYNAAVGAK